MAASMEFENRSESNFIIIYTDENTDSSIINTGLFTSNHQTNMFPIIDSSTKFQVSAFEIYAPDKETVIQSMKLFIKKWIIKKFPRSLCQCSFDFIWNLKITGRELQDELLEELYKSPVFEEIHYEIVYADKFSISSTECVVGKIMDYPNLRWGFNITNIKTNNTLERLICNYVAKRCLNNVIKAENYNEYFDNEIGKAYVDLRPLFNDMSFFSIVISMKVEKIKKFTEEYFKQLEYLALNHVLIERLKSFCPNPTDLEDER